MYQYKLNEVRKQGTYISLELLVLIVHSPSPEKQYVKRTFEGEVLFNLVIFNACTSKKTFFFSYNSEVL